MKKTILNFAVVIVVCLTVAWLASSSNSVMAKGDSDAGISASL